MQKLGNSRTAMNVVREKLCKNAFYNAYGSICSVKDIKVAEKIIEREP